MRQPELAMRVVLLVREHAARGHVDLAALTSIVIDRYGCHRSTAYRHARIALDVLGIHYDVGKARSRR